jgi:hypothetical protein
VSQVHTGATTIHYERGWWWKRGLNAVGSVVTFIVLIILIATKFIEGAWIVVLAIPFIIWLFTAIKRHYGSVAEALSTHNFSLNDMHDVADITIIPIADVHQGTLRALRYARRFTNNVYAVSIITSQESKERLERRWRCYPEITGGVNLVQITYDFRDVLTPLVNYIEQAVAEHPQQLVTVVVPEFIPTTASAWLLHNQTANMLRSRLRGYPGVVIINVPYHI